MRTLSIDLDIHINVSTLKGKRFSHLLVFVPSQFVSGEIRRDDDDDDDIFI